MKTIEFNGQVFEVDEMYKFIAMDSSGSIYAYTTKPTLDDANGYFYCDNGYSRYTKIGEATPLQIFMEI